MAYCICLMTAYRPANFSCHPCIHLIINDNHLLAMYMSTVTNHVPNVTGHVSIATCHF